MSVIAINCIPQTWNLTWTANTLRSSISGPFEALNFSNTGRNGIKTCYIQLSQKLDPVRVVEDINRTKFGTVRLKAFIPKRVPDLPLPKKNKNKKAQGKRNRFTAEPHQVIHNVHNELLLEVQYKYPALYNLSYKTGHKLLEAISKEIYERLKPLLRSADASESCFRVSSLYRRTYPHSGDYQLIVETLHKLQDASGAPRSQIQEKDLHPKPVNAPATSVDLNKATNKYSTKIIEAIMEHIDSLDSTPTQLDTEHETARKKVREELKKMVPYLPLILKQVVAKHFNPRTDPFHMIRIYGEPFLPKRDAMTPFVNRYHGGASRIIRHPRMYNLLMFKVTKPQYNALMAMDGTTINGAKLVIRSDQPTYKASDKFRAEMSAAFGGPNVPPPEDMDFNEAMDDNMDAYADDVDMGEE